MATHQLFLLGSFECTCDGEPVEIPPVAQRVLAYLALQNRPIARTVLAGQLWPETTDAKAATNLRSALTRIRSKGGPIIASTPSSLVIEPTVMVDVRQAIDAAQALLARNDPATATDVDYRIFTGVLLPELVDSWVVIEREQLRQLFLHALETLSQGLIGTGRSATAILTALAAVNIEPLRESSTRVLIQAHLAEGNWAEAWRAYDLYREVVETELGIMPSAELTRLIGADLANRRGDHAVVTDPSH